MADKSSKMIPRAEVRQFLMMRVFMISGLRVSASKNSAPEWQAVVAKVVTPS